MQSRFKSRLFGLHNFFAFFRKYILMNLRRQVPVRNFFWVRKIFRTQVFAGFAVFSFNTARKVSKYGVISGPYCPAFRLNMERYEASLRILSECGKIQTRNDSVFGHFHAVLGSFFIKTSSLTGC